MFLLQAFGERGCLSKKHRPSMQAMGLEQAFREQCFRLNREAAKDAGKGSEAGSQRALLSFRNRHHLRSRQRVGVRPFSYIVFCQASSRQESRQGF